MEFKNKSGSESDRNLGADPFSMLDAANLRYSSQNSTENLSNNSHEELKRIFRTSFNLKLIILVIHI